MKKFVISVLTLILIVCCIGLFACKEKEDCSNGHKFVGKFCSICSVNIEDISVDVYAMDYSSNSSNIETAKVKGYIVPQDNYYIDLYVVGEGSAYGNESFYIDGYSVRVKRIFFEDRISSISENLFKGCEALASIRLGEQSYLGYGLHKDCISITNIKVSKDSEKYQSIDGNLYSKDGKTLCQYAIGKKALAFNIPSSVTEIGSYAFAYCSYLTNISIPEGVTSIGSSVFSGCDNLQYNVVNGLKYLGNSSNQYLLLCGVEDETITTATINEGCKFIGHYAFSNCDSLTNISIPNCVTSIGTCSFYLYYGGTIYFNGTKAEWDAIEKDAHDNYFYYYTIICTDETIEARRY